MIINRNRGGGGGKETVTWHQCPGAVKNYLANVTYDPSDYSTSQITSYAPGTAVVSNTKPIGKTVDGVTYYNEVPNEATPFASDNVAGTVMPLDRLRWINSVTGNVRDLGGWTCDGGTVKYGKIIRGAAPNVADKDLMVRQIGIRQELELRSSQEDREHSVWDVEYSHTMVDVGYGITSLDAIKYLLQVVFDCVVENRTLYIHCAAGADRTGTLAVIIEGLLGMSQSDIDKDYELSCFYGGSSGTTTIRTRTEYVNLIASIQALSGSTFRDKLVNFVVSLGFSADEINAFRAAMIDGNPAILTPTVTNYTITKTLTHAAIDNPAASTPIGSRYQARVTPSEGYAIDDFSITMGGASAAGSAKTVISGGVVKNADNHFVDINIDRVTGNIAITAVGAQQGLPAAYQEVEWVGTADADSYVDTGIAFDQYGRTEWKGLAASSSSYMWGASEESGRWRWMHTITNSAAQVFGSNASTHITIALSYTDYLNAAVEFEAYSKANQGGTLVDVTNDRTKTVSTQIAYTMTATMYLLAQNYNGAARSKANMKLYYWKHYDKNGALVGDFVPCYRKQDSAIGFYNKVTGTFHGNLGNGTLTKGNDVQ